MKKLKEMVTTNKGMGCPVAKRPAHNSKFSTIALTIAVIVAFLMRMLSYSSVTANGNINFIGYDSFYHMRRILYTAYNFPHTLNFDSYINYPQGYQIGWPPFFDLLGGLLANIMGGGHPTVHTIEFAGALLPVILGVLTVIPLYVAASSVFNRKNALLAAFIFAVIPGHIYISQFGATDHHVAETLLSTSAYALFILALKWAREESLSLNSLRNISSEKKLIKPLVFAGASGFFFALMIYTWIGAPIFVSFIVLYEFIQTIIDLKAGKKSDYHLICAVTSILVTLLFTIPLSAMSVRPRLEMSAMYLSWFQVFYVFAMLAGTLILWGFSSYILKKDLDWKYYPAALILISVAGLLSLRIFSVETYNFIIQGIEYFLGIGEYLGTITEALPLFLDEQGGFSLSPVIGSLGLCLITTLGGFFLLCLEWKREKSKSEGVFFLLWSIFFAYLAFNQRRFTYLFAVNISILSAYFLWVLFESLDFETEVKKLLKSKPIGNNSIHEIKTGKETKSKTKSKMKTNNLSSSKKNSQPDYFKIISSIILLGFVFVPCAWIGLALADNGGFIDPSWKDSLTWLESSSPKTSYYDNPSKTPEYGVLSWWDYGNWIVYTAKRPAVSNNFQTGIQDSSLFFLTDSEKQANEIMKKLKVKYVIADKQMATGKFSSIVTLAGKNISQYLNIQTVNENGSFSTVATAKKAFINTEIYKLYRLDGSNLGNLRLVHESNVSEEEDNDSDGVKVFEFVSGAKLSGTTSPGQNITATLELSSNAGRKFTYQNEAVSDKNGSFEITVPYSTENTAGGVNALLAYTLKTDKNVTISGIQVTEKDIENGNSVEVKIPKAK